MRIGHISQADLKDWDMNDNSISSNEKVRSAMFKADRPACDCPPPSNTPACPADTLDPIMRKVLEDMNSHFQQLYFLTCVSACDTDYDKIPHCSAKWTKYGHKQSPDKSKK